MSAMDDFAQQTDALAPARASIGVRVKRSMQAPTPTSLIAAAVVVGSVCGAVAFLYSTVLDAFLAFTWRTIPATVVMPLWRWMAQIVVWPEQSWALYVYLLFVTTSYGLVVGATQRLLGPPGDLPETIGSFHHLGYVPYQQAPSMLVCSVFGVCGGGSLGPEAPLLTLCASAVTFICQKAQVGPVMLRYCTLLGMAAGLAAFFGVGIGGAFFALEVLHQNGLEYFEVIPFAITAGLVCLCVFRALEGSPFGEIWTFPLALKRVDCRHVLVGLVVGALAAAVAVAWTTFTKAARKALCRAGLDEHKRPIACGLLGGLLVGVIGAALPPTMFWGEFEMQTLANDKLPLPHIWPNTGLWGHHPFFEGRYTAGLYGLIGVGKLVAITVTLVAGFRGGFIFPLFTVGTALGTSLALLTQSVLPADAFPPVLFAMTFASGLNTAVTRTLFATPMILTTLCGQPTVAAPCVTAAVVALFLTRNIRFIATQQSRADVTTVLSSHSGSGAPGTSQNVLDGASMGHGQCAPSGEHPCRDPLITDI